MLTEPETVDLLRKITPEYEGPLYAVFTSNGLPNEYRMSGDVMGYTGFNLDAALSGWLGERYIGRGGCVVVDDLRIRECAGRLCDGDTSLEDAIVDSRVRATAVHEWAHCINHGIDRQPLNPATREVVRACLAKQLVVDCTAIERLAVPWEHHDHKFMRVLIHMLWRAAEFGERIPWMIAFVNEHYQLSTLMAYASALGNEPEQCAGLTFDEIKSLPLPEKYADTWRRDVTRWHRAKLAEVNSHYGAALADVGPGFQLEISR